EGYPVDVEDHGLLLLFVTGRPAGRPVSCRLVVAAMCHGRGCLLAASLAPVCVRCHHAGCVITGRIRAPAGALLAAAPIATDNLQHPPAAPRRHDHPGRRLRHQRPGTKKGSIVTAGTASQTAHLLAVMTKDDDLRPRPPGHCQGSVTHTSTQENS